MILKNDFLFKVALIFLIGAVGYLFLYNKKIDKNNLVLEQNESLLTLQQRINQKRLEFKIQNDIKVQQAISEKFKPPVEDLNINKSEYDDSYLQEDIEFSTNEVINSIVKDINEKPFTNDIYEDPENKIRSQIFHHNLLEQYLQQHNHDKKKAFIKKFIKNANQQGYKVYFKKNMQVILKPIE